MTENRIEVNGMRVWAHHGCMEEEAIIGQEYRIDVTIWADLGPSAATDDLDKTVDYVDVYRIVKREMGVRSKLVEQVCDRIVKGTARGTSFGPARRGQGDQIPTAHRRRLRPHLRGHAGLISPAPFLGRRAAPRADRPWRRRCRPR